jgi:hypothetical protein
MFTQRARIRGLFVQRVKMGALMLKRNPQADLIWWRRQRRWVGA